MSLVHIIEFFNLFLHKVLPSYCICRTSGMSSFFFLRLYAEILRFYYNHGDTKSQTIKYHINDELYCRHKKEAASYGRSAASFLRGNKNMMRNSLRCIAFCHKYIIGDDMGKSQYKIRRNISMWVLVASVTGYVMH